ncbi:hypothetical protein F5I97DRAFT_1927253 [Phlebopus sp. FC_14]|nr:hypothetical protein F5I97DRAFT_1927253 [Phlebopus sp. FC_14]
MNVVLIGENGTAKSSLINLIAGRNITDTPNDSTPCTTQIRFYQVSIDGHQFQLWDTAGLHDASEPLARASDPSDCAIKSLLQPLRHGRVDPLVYCMLGTRAKVAMINNYQAIHSFVPPSTPVIVIVTRLERYAGKMEDWWVNNQSELARLGMQFVDHACVTTLPVSTTLPNIIRECLEHSRGQVGDPIRRRCLPCVQFPTLPSSDSLYLMCNDGGSSEKRTIGGPSDDYSTITQMQRLSQSPKSILLRIPSVFAFSSLSLADHRLEKGVV